MVYEKTEGAELLAIREFFLAAAAPMNFDPYQPDNIIQSSEVVFSQVCTTMQEQGISDPKTLSEWEFYSKLQYFDKKFKDQSK